ncbi:hypothetical protein ITQ94_09055 [Pediococcus pentosaceus]|uniref:hypothetical protein n=1 Tax=Pediococcus pentosaceus TaxID=1255 RepID=UPI0018FE8429|nr:hypothetical protein [Pediococcus pentosaceus]MBF7131584.1 hypothetical protein [Pediococcus pentosaceus]
MTKDELNGILKKEGMYLSPVSDGTFNNVFYVVNESCVEVKFDGVDFIFSRDGGRGYGKKTVAALIDYANTPIEERKPKPQLYNIIIAQQCDPDLYYVAWRKNEFNDFEVDSGTLEPELNCEDYQFTQDEIYLLKKELPENQKKMVDLGVTPVKPKEEGALPF